MQMISYWKGAAVQLRAPDTEDIHVFESLDDAILQSHDSIAFPRTKAQIEEWMEQISQGASKDSDDFFWIAEDKDRNVVGTIEVAGCDSKNGTFDYGITVLPAYRGKGYAKDMIVTVLKHYFLELRYEKATINVYSFNQASISLHRKLGFKEEGRLRRMIYTGGQYYDEVYFGMTKEEFQELYPQ
ncbi:GNAT family N-acetyltransferase [Paenibacillus thiaminolyticus]|uniref:GNAT family N-acetyltransferase n=1 Tax=Paenibacillus thiaminolyticus TaxID=49283 RepID=UPI002350E5E6|nr:GNAT family protein [Paenibacillus thiaminolyticus]WCR28535.1 GNAT family N-acetyltransferase [Paenibacillus thiaminolyticus]